ncbi:MAG: TRAP transporter substrate-binding protein DctP [Deltaproteobacteria bacterium]|nr:TRAP transporter substrate-binding protein DctP [Deltaproteobacteria bacterium]
MVLALCAEPARAAVIKIATLSPEGSFWMKEMRAGGKEIAERTGNQVRFKFYPGGVMGDDKAVLRKIRLGQLQGGAVISGSLSGVYPDNQVYTLPIAFRSFEEVDYVRGHMDAIIVEGLAQNGLVVLGMAGGGFAYVMSRNPIQTIEDFRRQKMWVPDNDVASLETVQAFGVKPIPLSIADVRTGMQTGIINTIASPPVVAIALQWHTQVKYVTDTPLLYSYGFLAVDHKAFSKIRPEHQVVVREVMNHAFAKIQERNRVDNGKALVAMKSQGIEFICPSEQALTQWQATAATVADRLIKRDKLSKQIVSIMDKHLADFRQQQPIKQSE